MPCRPLRTVRRRSSRCGPGAVGGGGELEEAPAVVARDRVEERGGRAVAGAGDAVAVEAVAAIEPVAAGLDMPWLAVRAADGDRSLDLASSPSHAG